MWIKFLEDAAACWNEYHLENLARSVEKVKEEWLEEQLCKLKIQKIECTVLQLTPSLYQDCPMTGAAKPSEDGQKEHISAGGKLKSVQDSVQEDEMKEARERATF